MLSRSAVYGLPNTMTVLGMGRAINITRPDWIQHVQKTNFSNYVKGPKLHTCLKDLLGDGIFNADGHTWKAQRKVGSNIMTMSNLKNLVAGVLDAQSQRFSDLLQQAAKQGTPIDLQKAYFDFTIQTFLRIAFSTDLETVQSTRIATRSEQQKAAQHLSFADAFDLAQRLTVRRINRPWWKLTRPWEPSEKKLEHAIRTIDRYLYPLIERRSQNKSKADKRHADLLDLFPSYRDDQDQPLTPKQLRDALLNYLLAGRDTTAESLSWASFELLRHPEVVHDLRQELMSHSIWFDPHQKIDDDDAEQRSSSFELSHTKQLHHVRSIYHESLRLHPSVPRSSKIALQNDVLPGGVVVPKDTTVIWSDWLLARNKSVWGDDADEWKPRRWLNAEGEFINESPWKFHAFNGGPRTCLGIQLAQFQGMYMLSRIFSDFDLELESDRGLHFEPEVENTLTLPMKHPLMVRVYTRAKTSRAP